LLCIGAHDHACYPAQQAANHYPDDEVHFDLQKVHQEKRLQPEAAFDDLKNPGWLEHAYFSAFPHSTLVMNNVAILGPGIDAYKNQ
jgi:hypothetical protein